MASVAGKPIQVQAVRGDCMYECIVDSSRTDQPVSWDAPVKLSSSRTLVASKQGKSRHKSSKPACRAPSGLSLPALGLGILRKYPREFGLLRTKKRDHQAIAPPPSPPLQCTLHRACLLDRFLISEGRRWPTAAVGPIVSGVSQVPRGDFSGWSWIRNVYEHSPLSTESESILNSEAVPILWAKYPNIPWYSSNTPFPW